MLQSPVIRFLLKALVFFGVWYLLYELWILPDGRLDEWVSLNIVGISAGILETVGYKTYTINRIVGIMGDSGVEVVDRCNGIGALGLFLAFIFSYPGDWKNKLSFSVLGMGVIYLTNLFRITFLTAARVEWPDRFGALHNYTTTPVFYIVIFALWMLWVKTQNE
ncbi:MAG: exosortase/archaeosortase family protein [Balneolaceae bacterium]|nr:exosortase/archaeosortase family protein [Balneolaceae bacterium]